MCTERLEFGIDGMAYHAMMAAEHISRYFHVRQICQGKRVLDVACGEGYGSRLLAQWGAKEVVGIDISADAVQKAKKNFAGANTRFLVADACNLDPTFLVGHKFDLICSFETIEHVDDVDGFLRNVGELRSENSVVVMSCPNDSLLPAGESNPFHRRVLTFDAFKSATQRILGRAEAWFLGAPLQGYTIFQEHMTFDAASTTMDAAMTGRAAGDMWYLPSQHNISVRPDNADFYVGLWGATLPQVSVASSLSQTGFLEPWLLSTELDAVKLELRARKLELSASNRALEAAQRELERRSADLHRVEIVLAEERRASLTYRARTDSLHVGVTREEMREIAKEIWWERNRRSLPYKISKAIRQRFARTK